MSFNFVIPEFNINGAGTPPLQFFRRGFILNGTSGGGWREITLQGNTALTLVNALANSLLSLKLFGGTEQVAETYIDSVTAEGKCEQTGTPAPDNVCPITCNNGAIKCSPNLANMIADNITVGYYISNAGVVTESPGNFIYNKYIPVKPNTTYTLSMSDSVYYVTISEYSTASDSGFIQRNAGETGGNTSLTITTQATTNYIRFGSNIYGGSAILTLEQVQAINWMLTQSNTAQDYMPYGQIYVDGTTETITDNVGNTATCQNLLSVGTYKDTQEILSGAVSRNIGIKVLDGTESWTASGSLFYADIATDALQETHTCLCSHFEGMATNASASYQNKIKVGTNATSSVKWARVQIYPVAGTFSDVTDLKSWLAQQYANGTPVIVVYPTSSATTETVSGQVLTKAPVTYAGSVSGLTGTTVTSSHTTPTPTQPLQINCNNGIVKINGQGQVYADGTTEKVEVFGKNLFNPATVTTGAFVARDGSITSSGLYGYSDYIKIENGKSYIKSNITAGSVAFYNSSKTFVNRQDVTSFTATYDGYVRINYTLTDTNMQFEQGSTTTTYEPYYYGGSATATDLYAVGTYKDVQSVLDGDVTRNVGIKVLDGTETHWEKLNNSFANTTLFSDKIVGKVAFLCSHFNYSSANTTNIPDGCCGCASPTITTYFRYDACANVTDWTNWLKDQYNAGTPVIVIYQLATATTSSVTPQSLTIQQGTNIVEITQASIDGLPLEVSYKAGVTVTVEEVEAAQLDDDVTVTVS